MAILEGMSGRTPEEHVARPMVRQRWRDVAFLHWRYEPAVLQALLPPGFRVDTFEGTGWVSLTPFVVEVLPPLMSTLRVVSRFPETNLRTYVIGPDGRDGLWFLTLEADSIASTIGGRAAAGVPYRLADMIVESAGDQVTYQSRRRFGSQAGHHIVIGRGEACTADPLSDWLTGRWRAWTPRLTTVAVEHEPWPLVHAYALSMEQTLLADAGLRPPSGDPFVQASPGVNARLGWPDRAQRHGQRRSRSAR